MPAFCSSMVIQGQWHQCIDNVGGTFPASFPWWPGVAQPPNVFELKTVIPVSLDRRIKR